MQYFFYLLSVLFISNPAVLSDPDVPVTETKVTEIVLESADNMQFSMKEIKVEAGTTVKLTLKHNGKLPKQAFGHNFVLLKQGVDMKDFATKAVQAGLANDYVPEDSEDVIAYTSVIGGGESTTIEFEAPEAGEYTFLCSFPGHYALMNGTFIVE